MTDRPNIDQLLDRLNAQDRRIKELEHANTALRDEKAALIERLVNMAQDVMHALAATKDGSN